MGEPGVVSVKCKNLELAGSAAGSHVATLRPGLLPSADHLEVIGSVEPLLEVTNQDDELLSPTPGADGQVPSQPPALPADTDNVEDVMEISSSQFLQVGAARPKSRLGCPCPPRCVNSPRSFSVRRCYYILCPGREWHIIRKTARSVGSIAG